MTFNVRKSFNRTVAHELGHGAFTYEHPFNNVAYKTEQGTTHNLMDYVKDDELAYFRLRWFKYQYNKLKDNLQDEK